MRADPIKFCTHCGGKVVLQIPEADNRERHVCTNSNCRHIHYQNPKVVCGCLPVWGERILLCRRAIDPRKGLWTLPAGFMENGETTQQGAARETMEEVQAPLTNQTLYGIYNLPQINQVYIMFRADLTGETNFAPGAETLEARLFTEQQIPWQEIAFRVIRLTLKRYLHERQTGNFTIANTDITQPPPS